MRAGRLAPSRLRRPRIGALGARVGARPRGVRRRSRLARRRAAARSSPSSLLGRRADEAEFERRLWQAAAASARQRRSAARLGPVGERRSRRSALRVQLRRPRVLRRRPASEQLATGAAVPLAGAGVQSARAVRAAARATAVSSGCATASASASSRCRARSIRTSPTSASARRRASTPAARPRREWRCPFHRATATMTTARSPSPPRAADRAPASSSGAASCSRSSIREGEQVSDLIVVRARGSARMAVVGSHDRLRQHDLPDDRPRALFQSQPADVDDRRGHRRPARLPAHAVQPGNVHDPLQDDRPPSELLREPRQRTRAVRHRARRDPDDVQRVHERRRAALGRAADPAAALAGRRPHRAARRDGPRSSASPPVRPSCRTTDASNRSTSRFCVGVRSGNGAAWRAAAPASA